ncbi:hypothetical protein [Advenella sp. S44]|uniref:hypothetical protein n=1 Tax=Advenella sp. S44 TaxID=1982755 RepID=UPI0012902B17|nr:hypothetical protein [Advenella sp. S44]
MDKRYAIRRKRLRQLIDERAGGVDAHFADTYGYSRAQIGQYLSVSYRDGKSIGDLAARNIEKKLDLPALWLDTEVEQNDWPFEKWIALDRVQKLSAEDIAFIAGHLSLLIEDCENKKTQLKP